MSNFSEYIERGWVLTPVQPGSKGPRTRGWNRLENCVSDPAKHMLAAGLAHAYSGTCAIDVDDFRAASEWLAERGVDLDALFAAPDSVQISSGREGHGKLLYTLPEPIASKQIKVDKKSVIDFRCATAAGLTMQDVLPPSVHPDTGMPYKWAYGDDMIGDWRSLPEIPAELYQIWYNELTVASLDDTVPEKGAALDELRDLLKHQDPNMARDDWVRVGMAIHHETDGEMVGFQLWDKWSQGSEKYAGRSDLETVWRSFHDSPNAVTVGTLRQGSVAAPEEFPDVHESTEDDPWAAAAQARKARFRLVQVGEIAKREPPEWLVEGLVPQADLAMMYGNSGAGKSFLALDLSFAMAHGFTWFNRATKKGAVVWIAAEAAGTMRNRAKAYAQARGVQLEHTDFWVIEQTLSLMSPEDAKALNEVLAEARPQMIVIDTLAAASGGANENSGEDMNVVLSNCRKLHKVTGALILLVHHSGKDASRGARGWSGLRAAVDAEFEVTASESSPIRVMKVTKQRDAADGIKMPFKLLTVPLDFDNTESCVIESLDETLLSDKEQKALGGTQKLVFQTVYNMLGLGDDPNGAVSVHDVYDAATIEMPAPPKGVRDRRGEVIRRALAALHEKGYLTIADDKVTIGSTFDED